MTTMEKSPQYIEIKRLSLTLPENIERIVVAKFAVQSFWPRTCEEQIEIIKGYMKGFAMPLHLERMRVVDNWGYTNDVLYGYWLDVPTYEAWFARPDVQTWWQGLSLDSESDLGFWREIAFTSMDRFQHSTKTHGKVNGAANILPLGPHKRYTETNLYHSRFRGGKDDTFETAIKSVPVAERKETKGKRLYVNIPDNIAMLRDAEDRRLCGEEENKVFNRYIDPTVRGWMNRLISCANDTGMLVLRGYQELDLETGDVLEKRSIESYVLSVEHITQAARHYLVHRNIVKDYVEMSKAGKIHDFLPWVEAHILKKEDFESEYVNCHPFTGLMPYFEVKERR